MKHNSVTTIKCKFSNEVHKFLEPNIGIKKNQRYRLPKKELTDAEKIEKFNKIVKFHKECSEEISAALYKRREKKRIQAKRVKYGYVPKKKTSKKEYESMLQIR
jgi:hypothetical protein